MTSYDFFGSWVCPIACGCAPHISRPRVHFNARSIAIMETCRKDSRFCLGRLGHTAGSLRTTKKRKDRPEVVVHVYGVI